MNVNQENVSLGKDVIVVPDNPQQEVQEKMQQIQLALRNNPEVIQIANSMREVNAQTITEFGHKPAEEISKFADRILATMKSSSVEDSGVLIKQLAKVMDKFDIKEIEPVPRGVISRLFYNGKKQIEKLFEKYRTFGMEIEKIHNELVKYKEELNKANRNLDEMYRQNLNFYETIEKYIAAGRMILEHIKQNELPAYEQRAQSGEQRDLVALEECRNAIEMFEQRIYDLEMAKMVAIQTAPQIRLIQRGNYKLISKIHSAFIITIPVFKQGIIQAVTLKRQKIMADSLAVLDEKTNELLKQNARNTVEQSIQTARLAGTSSIKLETIQENFDIIINGLAETKAIEEENRRIREEGTKQIYALQEGMQRKMLQPGQQ